MLEIPADRGPRRRWLAAAAPSCTGLAFLTALLMLPDPDAGRDLSWQILAPTEAHARHP